MKFGRNVLFFMALLGVAAFVDAFNSRLEQHYWERKPLREIQTEDRDPAPTVNMLIDAHCPHERGKLGEFLKCREEIRSKMLRDDI